MLACSKSSSPAPAAMPTAAATAAKGLPCTTVPAAASTPARRAAAAVPATTAPARRAPTAVPAAATAATARRMPAAAMTATAATVALLLLLLEVLGASLAVAAQLCLHPIPLLLLPGGVKAAAVYAAAATAILPILPVCLLLIPHFLRAPHVIFNVIGIPPPLFRSLLQQQQGHRAAGLRRAPGWLGPACQRAHPGHATRPAHACMPARTSRTRLKHTPCAAGSP